jgi:hypothetical protein
MEGNGLLGQVRIEICTTVTARKPEIEWTYSKMSFNGQNMELCIT